VVEVQRRRLVLVVQGDPRRHMVAGAEAPPLSQLANSTPGAYQVAEPEVKYLVPGAFDIS